MSRKTKGKAPFYFFMIDWQKRLSANGQSVSQNLKDVATDPRCSEEWNNLTPQQKGYYVAMAKESKYKAQGTACKKNTLGQDISEVEEQERKKQEFEEKMFQYIDSAVFVGTQHNNLHKLKFMFIHVNWFYQRTIGINKFEFCPASFAVAEFSLENGVENIYHELLNMKMPLGWKRDAIENSERTHKIPIEFEEGEKDFAAMYNKLVHFLESNKTGNNYPPLFTVRELFPVVDSLLVKMTDAAGKSVDEFLIYSIEALFAALYNAASRKVGKNSIPLPLADNEFRKDVFSANSGFECEFHKIYDGASQYCSKSIVTRWGFTICDYCCEYFDIEMIDGVHRPPRSSDILRPDIQKIISGNRKAKEENDCDSQNQKDTKKAIQIIDHSKHNIYQEHTSFDARAMSPNNSKMKPKSPFSIDESMRQFTLDDFPPIS